MGSLFKATMEAGYFMENFTNCPIEDYEVDDAGEIVIKNRQNIALKLKGYEKDHLPKFSDKSSKNIDIYIEDGLLNNLEGLPFFCQSLTLTDVTLNNLNGAPKQLVGLYLHSVNGIKDLRGIENTSFANPMNKIETNRNFCVSATKLESLKYFPNTLVGLHNCTFKNCNLEDKLTVDFNANNYDLSNNRLTKIEIKGAPHSIIADHNWIIDVEIDSIKNIIVMSFNNNQISNIDLFTPIMENKEMFILKLRQNNISNDDIKRLYKFREECRNKKCITYLEV